MIDDITILLIGIDTPHHTEFIYERPQGSGSYTIMCFSTPFFIRTQSGIEIGKPGDCIIHDPNFHQVHGTVEGMSQSFRNDWLHLAGDNILKLAVKYDIPLNNIIHTGQIHLLSEQLKKIEYERSYHRPFCDREIHILIEELFLTIGRYRQMDIELETFTLSEREYKKKFIAVRCHIHDHIDETWDIKKMSKLLNLSTNRFSVLYQKFFKISPKDDLISKRIEKAKILLINSNLSIEQVSNSCNFSTLYYFSRIFKKRVGCCPSSFRKRIE